jgi:uncharacterized membrane protein
VDELVLREPERDRRQSSASSSTGFTVERCSARPRLRYSERTAKGDLMAIGPVQLLVLGFQNPDFRGEILAELDRLKENDVVRVIDGLAVYKDANGEVTVLERSDLSDEEAAEFGAVVGALIGAGMAGAEGAEAGAQLGAEAAAAKEADVADDEDVWDVVDDIPNDTAAALILLEHRWAIPLRDAIVRAGGFRISDGFIHPLDLVAVGVLAAEEAAASGS